MANPPRRDRDAVNEIFGDSLPSITRDEYDHAHPDDADAADRWLRDNIPPHHS